MPMSTVRPPLTRETTIPLTGVFVVGGFFELVPDLVAQGFVVGDDVALAAILLFALYDDFNGVTGGELGGAVGID